MTTSKTVTELDILKAEFTMNIVENVLRLTGLLYRYIYPFSTDLFYNYMFRYLFGHPSNFIKFQIMLFSVIHVERVNSLSFFGCQIHW